MKKIGLIGGMAWPSTLEYYKIINKLVSERLGGSHSARIGLESVDFQEIEELQHEGKWKELGKLLTASAKNLENGGADCILICTNTMHKVAGSVEESVSIPLIHIATQAAKKALAGGIQTIGLLGTKFTMEKKFYKERLIENGLQVLIPKKPEREAIHKIIYGELCNGQLLPESKETFVEIMENLQKRGAEGVILGCTEIPLLVKQQDIELPLFDTTEIHSQAAVEFALSN